jgi:hypothetical protein
MMGAVLKYGGVGMGLEEWAVAKVPGRIQQGWRETRCETLNNDKYYIFTTLGNTKAETTTRKTFTDRSLLTKSSQKCLV